jgi:hypothetical protein
MTSFSFGGWARGAITPSRVLDIQLSLYQAMMRFALEQKDGQEATE